MPSSGGIWYSLIKFDFLYNLHAWSRDLNILIRHFWTFFSVSWHQEFSQKFISDCSSSGAESVMCFSAVSDAIVGGSDIKYTFVGGWGTTCSSQSEIRGSARCWHCIHQSVLISCRKALVSSLSRNSLPICGGDQAHKSSDSMFGWRHDCVVFKNKLFNESFLFWYYKLGINPIKLSTIISVRTLWWQVITFNRKILSFYFSY